MNQTAEQLYLTLTKIPQHQWPSVIGNLNSKLKQSLLSFLRKKRLGNNIGVAVNVGNSETVSAQTDSRRFTTNDVANCKTDVAGATVSGKRLPKLIAPAESDITVKKLRTSGVTEAVKPELSPSFSDPTPALFSVNVVGACPLDSLRSFMYVSGDAYNVSSEAQDLVHRYLNVYLGCILAQSNSAEVPVCCSGGTVKRDHKNYRGKNQRLTHLAEAVRTKFSAEYATYTKKLAFQKTARSQFSGCTQVAESSTSENTTDYISESQDALLTELHHKDHTAVDAADVTLSAIRDHIKPTERFSQRLAARDVRTKHFNATEYQMFARSREQSFRGCKRSFTEWANLVATVAFAPFFSAVHASSPKETPTTRWNNSATVAPNVVSFPCSSDDRIQLPPALIEFLLFLVADRIASIVELALRFRLSLISNTLSTHNGLENIQSDPTLLVELWRQGFRFPALTDALVPACLGKHAKQETLISPLQLCHYKTAIMLLLHYDDALLFNIDAAELIALLASGPVYLPLFTQSDGIQQRKGKQTLVKRQTPSERESPTSSTSELEMSSHAEQPTVTPSDSSKPGALASDASSNPVNTSGQQALFNCVVQTAMQQAPPPAIPEELVTFAYLKCRDLFWTFRHDQPRTLWSAIRDRYTADLQSATPDFANFKETYKKILQYSEAVHKIVALGSFFNDIIHEKTPEAPAQGAKTQTADLKN